MPTPLNKCPVPFSQQPLNEFNYLKNSCFFSWPIDSDQFLAKLVFIWIINNFLNVPIISSFFSIFESPWKFLVSDFAISSVILILALIRLYLGWSYVIQRLFSATVFYEESGWYDGQIWIKPSAVLKQDRLIGQYQVLPLLTRIKKVLLIINIILLFEFIFYMFLF